MWYDVTFLCEKGTVTKFMYLKGFNFLFLDAKSKVANNIKSTFGYAVVKILMIEESDVNG